jgi:hypothetical protein
MDCAQLLSVEHTNVKCSWSVVTILFPEAYVYDRQTDLHSERLLIQNRRVICCIPKQNFIRDTWREKITWQTWECCADKSWINRMRVYKKDSAGSRMEKMESCCEQCHEPRQPLKGGTILTNISVRHVTDVINVSIVTEYKTCTHYA